MSAAEIEAIVAAANEPFLMQKDIAIRFRITQTLVSTLICEAKRAPEKLQQLRERERQLVAKKEAVEAVVASMLAINKPIVGAKQVQAQVLETTGLTVVPSLTRHVMRKDLCMGYRRAKIVTVQSNSERCLV